VSRVGAGSLLVGGLCALLVLPPPAAAAPDQEPSVSWQHEWLPTRLFDYRHQGWKTVNEAALWALYVTHDETIRHEADGSTVRRWEFELSVRDPDRIGELFHVGSRDPDTDTTFSAFEVTWTTGGRTTSFSEDDLLEVAYDAGSPYISARTGLYLPIDRRSPGILRGTLETHDRPEEGFASLMAGFEPLQVEQPCRHRTVRVEVPQGTPLSFETRFFTPAEPVVAVTEGGFDTYTWRFSTLWPPAFERAMPHPLDSYPVLWWSNVAQWTELAGKLDAAWEPELVATREMTAWAEELVAGRTGTLERARAIHDAVADGWDYLGFYPGESGWIPHPAEECWVARLGDCKDKTALMVTLMRAVGLQAHPAVVHAGATFALPSTPQNVFNHAIVWVDDGDEGFFLDSVDAGLGSYPVRATLADREALIVDAVRGGLRHIPTTPAERWLHEDETVLRIAEDGSARVEVTRRWVGVAANERAYAASRTEPHRWTRRQRSELLAGFPGAEIVSLDEGPDLGEPGDAWTLRASLSQPLAIARQGAHALVHLPWLGVRSPGSVPVDRGDRTHPEVLAPLHLRSRVKLVLPPNLAVLALPPGGGEERERWLSRLEARAEGSEVVVDLLVVEHPGPMDKGLQEARRNFVAAVGDLQAQAVVLRVAP
jgi:hypothetical protein